MTPTDRLIARGKITAMREWQKRHWIVGTVVEWDPLLAFEKALDALDQRDALLRDVRDHVQQCCGCLTYGDWLDKIRATIGEPQERLCECKTDRAVYPCKVGNLAGRYVCTECGEPTEPAPTASPS